MWLHFQRAFGDILKFGLLISLFYVSEVSAQTSFSKAEILEDMAFLRSSLTDAHYNLYAYTSKEDFNNNYERLKATVVKDSFDLLEATSLFQHIISKVNNGHTEIGFPGTSYIAYVRNGGTVFPLEIAFEKGTPLIRKNWSANDSITPGDEIVSINGMTMNEVVSRIYPLVSAERPYFKNAKIEAFSFPRYYWQVFGRVDNFDVAIRQGERIERFQIEAIDALEGYEMKREEVLNAKMTLRFFEDTAYLNPGNFSGDEQKYQAFIDSSFAVIRERKSKDLIIDFRNNQGGDDSFSNYLISYFADRPFTWNSRFTLKTSQFLKDHVIKEKDTTDAYWKEALNRKNGEIYEYAFEPYQPQPEHKRFKGRVYVLVNRQSHSQSAVAAAQIQDYGFATIAGEETGDFPSLYASIYHYSLPNTGIRVSVSKGYIIRVNGSTAEEGVIPEIYIKDFLLDEEDEILSELLKMIDPAEQ
ncbi:S41 family peptidase [Robertkochia aurantiaca]|uniref:S41 family peptidase n=1 Tax=Robertkochia aurantiaca TaxID=2873700 RepID=UPI001CCA3BB0|nr:S41 family peptidase [Robertkochia sp. 3YJGBD-33]